MKINRRDPRHWVLLALQRFYTLLAIVLRPLSRKPAKPVVLLYGHQLSGNLKALYEEWERAFRDRLTLYYLSLDPDYAAQLQHQGVPVLRCNRLRDMLSLTTASAMVTDHGLHAMGPLLRFTDIRFIDVWHGIPFKGFVPEEFRVQHRYDEIWVSSPLLKRLYVEKFGFPAGVVRDLGYARTDRLFRVETAESRLRLNLQIPEDRKIVLYAPTWQQDDQGRELFPFGQTQDAFIDALSQVCAASKAALVLRSHLNAEIAQRDFEHVYYAPMSAFPDSEAVLLETDVLICDWSSIAFDFLALNRPTLFLDVPPPFKHGFSLGPEYRFGQVTSGMEDLVNALVSVLESAENYFSKYEASHEKICTIVYSESTRGSAARQQMERLLTLVGAAQ